MLTLILTQDTLSTSNGISCIIANTSLSPVQPLVLFPRPPNGTRILDPESRYSYRILLIYTIPCTCERQRNPENVQHGSAAMYFGTTDSRPPDKGRKKCFGQRNFKIATSLTGPCRGSYNGGRHRPTLSSRQA